MDIDTLLQISKMAMKALMNRDFEKQFSEYRLDKEERGLWTKGIVYQCGETNALYTAFIAGYSAGRCAYLNQ